MRFRLNQIRPQVADDAYIAPTAVLIGRVDVQSKASVWFNAVLRGDNEPITLGPESNVQDGCVLHTDPGFPLTLGRAVTVGHNVVLHGCSIGDECLIGMGAIIMNGAKIGHHCLIGAGSLITEGKQIPDGSMVLGAPARVVRALKPEEIEKLRQGAAIYVRRSVRFQEELDPDD